MSVIRVIFAVDDPSERAAFAALAGRLSPPVLVHFPAGLAEVEKIYSTDGAEAIVTDYRFHNGALADWLTLWPLPTVLLIDPGDDPERVERTTRDEAAAFLERRPDGKHLSYVPVLLRKMMNIRESVSRQNAHLQMTEHQYLNLIQAIPDIVYMLDGQGRFMYLNDAISSIGYDPSKLLGKHFSEIIHPSDLPRVSRVEVLGQLRGMVTGPAGAPKLFDERRAGERMTKNLEIRLRIMNGPLDYTLASVNSYGEVSCAGYKLPEFEGLALGTVGIIRDITARKEHERQIEEALAAKEVLLKEIHHRVKNNLQVVSSLLGLQEPAIADEGARRVFVECQTQIQSMSMVHEMLYKSGEFEGVVMQRYFERLLDYLSSVYEGGPRGLSSFAEAGRAVLDLEIAIPAGLIANELVSNCYKHAFPGRGAGRVTVSMAAYEDDWLLAVADDGVGFAATKDPAKDRGIGTELVHALAAQLKGSVSLSDSPEGAVVKVRFPRAPG
jgi:PAS domain S-box-containing protein